MNSKTEALIQLRSTHSFGRDVNNCDTGLSDSLCSRNHCIIEYIGNTWVLIDHSKNGTYVNNKKVEAKRVSLNKDDTLTFSKKGGESFIVISTEPPQPFLINQSKNHFIQLTSNNILPNENHPELLIYRHNFEWVLEHDKTVKKLYSHDNITLNKESWVFFPNDTIQDTVTHAINGLSSIHRYTLYFSVSLNEENVQVSIQHHDDTLIDFGYKAHHHILLILARQRLLDEARCIPDSEHGWIANEVLTSELGIDTSHLNTHIYRLRKAFEEIKFPQTPVERRFGELRLSTCPFIIKKGNTNEQYMMQ
ncbi:FHA domain-containing protein [Marinibactrum halimedae]|nr:FHA domain-containing protein [Marinibactrum halimedae]MCD9460561.1 FHA domain-containing protein [Marinibactrum halimedae]